MSESEFKKSSEALVIEDVGMSEKIRKRVVRDMLPESLGAAMDEMAPGQSVFIKAINVQRKMYALRSKYYRWRQKNENSPHQFSLIQETDEEGNKGIRMYKYDYMPAED